MVDSTERKDNTPLNGDNLDFSEIDNIEKAINLYEKGSLTKMYLLPLEFGGEDNPVNILYVPKVVQELKERFDKMIEEMLIEGKSLSYSSEPEYKGNSFIPSKINVGVTGDSNISKTITIGNRIPKRVIQH